MRFSQMLRRFRTALNGVGVGKTARKSGWRPELECLENRTLLSAAHGHGLAFLVEGMQRASKSEAVKSPLQKSHESDGLVVVTEAQPVLTKKIAKSDFVQVEKITVEAAPVIKPVADVSRVADKILPILGVPEPQGGKSDLSPDVEVHVELPAEKIIVTEEAVTEPTAATDNTDTTVVPESIPTADDGYFIPQSLPVAKGVSDLIPDVEVKVEKPAEKVIVAEEVATEPTAATDNTDTTVVPESIPTADDGYFIPQSLPVAKGVSDLIPDVEVKVEKPEEKLMVTEEVTTEPTAATDNTDTTVVPEFIPPADDGYFIPQSLPAAKSVSDLIPDVEVRGEKPAEKVFVSEAVTDEASGTESKASGGDSQTVVEAKVEETPMADKQDSPATMATADYAPPSLPPTKDAGDAVVIVATSGDSSNDMVPAAAEKASLPVETGKTYSDSSSAIVGDLADVMPAKETDSSIPSGTGKVGIVYTPDENGAVMLPVSMLDDIDYIGAKPVSNEGRDMFFADLATLDLSASVLMD